MTAEGQRTTERLWLTCKTTSHILLEYLAALLRKTDCFLVLDISTLGLNICLIHKVTSLLTETGENCSQDCLQGWVTRMGKDISLLLHKKHPS